MDAPRLQVGDTFRIKRLPMFDERYKDSKGIVTEIVDYRDYEFVGMLEDGEVVGLFFYEVDKL